MNGNMADMEEKMAFLEQKVSGLEMQNASLKRECDTLMQMVRDIYEINKQIMLQVSQMEIKMTTISMTHDILKMHCGNVAFESLDGLVNQKTYYFPIIRSREETVEEIINHKKSMARFGDGEFSQIIKVERQAFQRMDDKLGLRLEEVLHSNHPDMLIAIANNYGNLDIYTDFAASGIREYMYNKNMRKQHMELLERDRVYYDAYVSRPYVMYRDNMTDAPKQRFRKLQEIWEGRNVIVVEGAQTRMGVGNDLLDRAKAIKRILAPVTSSFDRYDDILKASLKHGTDDTLFLIAMGPSAGVLAYDLTVEGYQAIDIGHLDLEYEWFLAGKGERVPIPNKYNNEVPGDDYAEEWHDPIYEKQIVENLS